MNPGDAKSLEAKEGVDACPLPTTPRVPLKGAFPAILGSVTVEGNPELKGLPGSTDPVGPWSTPGMGLEYNPGNN